MQTSGGKHLIWEFSIFVMIFQGISRRIQEFELEQIMLHPFMENPPCNRESLNSKSSMIINCMTVCFHNFVLVLIFSGWYWMISIQSSKNQIIGKTWWHFPPKKNIQRIDSLAPHEVCCLHRLGPLRWDHHGALLCSVSRRGDRLRNFPSSPGFWCRFSMG